MSKVVSNPIAIVNLTDGIVEEEIIGLPACKLKWESNQQQAFYWPKQL